MSRDRSRNNHNRKSKRVVLVAYEGENKTEKNYLSNFSGRDKDYIIKPVPGNETDPVNLVKQTVQKVQESINKNLKIGGIFFTMYDSRTRLAQDVVMQVKSYFKDLVFNTIIPRNIRLSEAPSHGLPICKYDPKSKGAKAYSDLADEILERNNQR